ncbi:MAG: CAP domain-containing protein [Cyanobacteria bacterium J06627_28]
MVAIFRTKHWPLCLGLALGFTGLAYSLPAYEQTASSRGTISNGTITLLGQNATQAQAQSAPFSDSSTGTFSASDWAALEQNILLEHNRIRQNPQSYIPILEAHLARMDANGNLPNACGQNCTLITQEGQSAVREAIAFLQNQSPMGPLDTSPAIAQAAKGHAQYQQTTGTVGHSSADGSTFAQRLNRAGITNVTMAENIAYGPTTAQEVVMNLVIDDGVASRGHRTNIFTAELSLAGVGCDAHRVYGSVCVIDYASQ